MVKLRAVRLNVNLPEISTEESRTVYSSLTLKLERYVKGIGTNSSLFRARKDELVRASDTGKNITEVMQSLAYVRPLLELWRKEMFFLEKVPPDDYLLSHIGLLLSGTRRNRLGRLAIREAFDVFFLRYDRLGSHVEAYSSFLRHQLGQYNDSELMFGLDKIKQKAIDIVSPKGHLWLARNTAQLGSTLPDEASRYSIPMHSSRFYKCSQQEYYIQRISRLAPSENDAVLTEVRNKKVYDAQYGNEQKLGHTIVELLIDKLSSVSEEPADSWLKTILSIAGDPRVPSGHQNYRLWWSFLGQKRVELMRRWLSKMDMELFLEIVKEFSERKGGEDMKRMFAKRKRFLLGLFEEQLVQDAQLFLAWQPEDYLTKSISDKDERPYFQRLTGGDNKLTIFYFRLGNIHLVEGTHSFALTILDKLPDNSPIGKYSSSNVFSRSLGIGLFEDYQTQYGNSEKCKRIVHNSKWVVEAYNMLKKLGVNIAPDAIMDAEDYRRLRN